jgi:hypothetical protein
MTGSWLNFVRITLLWIGGVGLLTGGFLMLVLVLTEFLQ